MGEYDNLQEELDRAYRRLMKMAETDPQLHQLLPDDKVKASIEEPGIPYQEVLRRGLRGYASRPAFGTRAYERRADQQGRFHRHYLPSYQTVTYGQIEKNIEAVASTWRRHPRHAVKPGEFLAYFVFSGAEMAMIDMATAYGQIIGVPIQANLPAADVMKIFEDTDPAAIVASIENLELAVNYALRQPTIRSLIVIDVDMGIDSERELVEESRARLLADGDRIAFSTFDEFVDYGAQFDWTPLPAPEAGNDAMSMLMYTSGSTGTPKGAIIHHAMNVQFWRIPRHQPSIAVAYAPMNHFTGRIMIHTILAQGGTVYFSLKSDLSTLLDDIRIARPTTVVLLPRMLEQIYQTYQSDVLTRTLAGEDPAAADAAVREQMRKTYLGDRLVVTSTGSAPTSAVARQFVRECFDVVLIEGYGSTETGGGGVTIGNRILRNIVTDYKLIDVPELGYYTSDKPYPRGELALKTRLTTQGYWKRPEATAAIFDSDGYYLTGDIVEERAPDEIVWLDRRNNVVKLSQGEFVAIGPLESKYVGASAVIQQMYIYASSMRSFLLAVVVPDMNVVRDMLAREPSEDELRQLIQTDIQTIARKSDVKSFEIPRDIIIEREPFTLENGLLSSVRKPLRPNLKRRYQERLEALYEDMDRKQQEELTRLRTASAHLPTIDRVVGALKSNLGLDSINSDLNQTYRDLGGDSLGAVTLATLMEEIFEVSLPISLILGPAGTADRMAAYIDNAVSGEGQASPTFESVHGRGADKLEASDLTLDKFFDEETLRGFSRKPSPAHEVKTVLLTGATGFLGRFLCLDWLERLAPVGGKLICVIRADDIDDARARLDAAIGSEDAELSKRFALLAAEHLEVMTGDLALPRLGMSEAQFDYVARVVDKIVHPGALVNHRLSYANLFEPNVVGTAELVRLALTERQKLFDYISTVGVCYAHPALTATDEDVDVRDVASSYPLSDGYANGYNGSKWASEILLREAHDGFGLQVNVFRPGMILAHSRFVGQINAPDLFSRLLYSVAVSGVAPKSFYELATDGERQLAHYDGLPVDFLATVIGELGVHGPAGFETYNLYNPHHDDGVSLDTVVDWIGSAGYPVKRIESHDEWLRLFEQRLSTLPDHQRQHSLLDVMGAFAAPYGIERSPVQTRKLEGFIGKLSRGGEIPHITAELVHKSLMDLTSLNILPHPGR